MSHYFFQENVNFNLFKNVYIKKIEQRKHKKDIFYKSYTFR